MLSDAAPRAPPSGQTTYRELRETPGRLNSVRRSGDSKTRARDATVEPMADMGAPLIAFGNSRVASGSRLAFRGGRLIDLGMQRRRLINLKRRIEAAAE